MAEILVIPDIHLKSWIFNEAEKILKNDSNLKAVCLMDIPDDFGQQNNMNLYEATIRRAGEFAKDFPETLWCFGNHDASYLWHVSESGYSYTYSYLIEKELRNLLLVIDEKASYIHRIDNTLFMHGGLYAEFLEQNLPEYKDMTIDEVINAINQFGADKMWNDFSPMWARPQGNTHRLYPEGMLQVVGHTPLKSVLYDKKRGLLSCDTFSTHSNGDKFGEKKFVIVNTIEKTWKYA